MIAVISRPGRDALTARTIELLDGNGGGSTVDGERLLWWVGHSAPPKLPAEWVFRWARREPNGIDDCWELLRMASIRSGDLHFFEDDVIPCRNLLPRLVRDPVQRFTSYFNPRRRPRGPWKITTNERGFACSQAISIPARLVAQLATADPRAAHNPPRVDFDVCLSDWLQIWREPVVYGPSWVQHVHGPRADGKPRSSWLHDPAFVGEDFDALAAP